jgi:hypothetical protein
MSSLFSSICTYRVTFDAGVIGRNGLAIDQTVTKYSEARMFKSLCCSADNLYRAALTVDDCSGPT